MELNNVFSTLPVLRGYQGYGAAVFVPFTERVALRAGVDFDRFADPVFETTTAGGGSPTRSPRTTRSPRSTTGAAR